MAAHQEEKTGKVGSLLSDVEDTIVPISSSLNVDVIIKKLLANENDPSKQVCIVLVGQ